MRNKTFRHLSLTSSIIAGFAALIISFSVVPNATAAFSDGASASPRFKQRTPDEKKMDGYLLAGVVVASLILVVVVRHLSSRTDMSKSRRRKR